VGLLLSALRAIYKSTTADDVQQALTLSDKCGQRRVYVTAIFFYLCGSYAFGVCIVFYVYMGQVPEIKLMIR